mmetsp:Transcript_11027/g.24655  ORF Transcript_11027/g.24655 Transcript_11027/m.24655 type:complete len:112 (+) Transcript_11027:1032-1367(+)
MRSAPSVMMIFALKMMRNHWYTANGAVGVLCTGRAWTIGESTAYLQLNACFADHFGHDGKLRYAQHGTVQRFGTATTKALSHANRATACLSIAVNVSNARLMMFNDFRLNQ